ncbi:unnamed protein product [Oppiella nova]|uniref:non-specific serine/threonine protein kinase n=1 Tax=Oppiella nova TaxID=334625 RepID=A0A7R9LK22_9ACAR|nr:unnamed protein product [Oppiella nova]CAG2163751.1 unnamed protein product [Oppiella nova]
MSYYSGGKVSQEAIDTPRQLAVNVQCLSIDNHYKDLVAIRKNDSIYQILPDNQISRRDGYQDFEDFYAKLLQITYNNTYLLPLNTDNSSHRESDTSSDESIEVIQRSYVKSKSNTMSRSSDHSSRSSVSSISGNSLPESNSYAMLFRNPVLVGSGDFTESQKQKAFREMKVLVKVRSEYVVQYYNSWIEANVLYIQMELCCNNFQNILEVKPQVFGRQLGEAMDCAENGRFVKLCDFGLATVHDKRYNSPTYKKHTSDVGTIKYQAPEFDKHTVGQIKEYIILNDVDPLMV